MPDTITTTGWGCATGLPDDLRPHRGSVSWEAGRSVTAIVEALNAKLHELGATQSKHLFGPRWDVKEIPTTKAGPSWLAVFPVTGANEGIYLHIHHIAIRQDLDMREAPLLALAKVWDWEEAWRVVRVAHALLNA